MPVGDMILTAVLSQEPARPEVPPVRLSVASLLPVDPSGRMFSSCEVNVWPSSEITHFDFDVTFPSRLVVDSQLLGPVVLIDQVSPNLVTCPFPSRVMFSTSSPKIKLYFPPPASSIL